mmetsp:Transcript_29906/g.69154  ORF Transcript_29906/g.69154 Transcript_29906/m.69154 type:complete len:222 (+) Transcript_29906:42-707(+)
MMQRTFYGRGRSQQAQGPDGTRGFAAGRGKVEGVTSELRPRSVSDTGMENRSRSSTVVGQRSASVSPCCEAQFTDFEPPFLKLDLTKVTVFPSGHSLNPTVADFAPNPKALEFTPTKSLSQEPTPKKYEKKPSPKNDKQLITKHALHSLLSQRCVVSGCSQRSKSRCAYGCCDECCAEMQTANIPCPAHPVAGHAPLPRARPHRTRSAREPRVRASVRCAC